MLLYSYAKWIFCLSMCLHCCMAEPTKISWLGRFVQYVRRDARVHQVLILFNEDGNSEKFEEERIIQGISKRLPTWKISFQDSTDRKVEEWSKIPSLYEPQLTTLVVIIHLSTGTQILSRLSAPMMFASHLAPGRSRPKCLFILPLAEKDSSYERLLRRLWSEQFLDVTILQLAAKDNVQAKRFQDLRYKAAVVNYFNPFLNAYKKVRYTSKLLWFPDKTRNLHGYELRVGGPPREPLLYFSLNESGHVVRAYGPQSKRIQDLSKAMNFKILWTPSKEKGYGKPDCNIHKTTGYIHNIRFNEINFLAATVPRVKSCKIEPGEYSFNTERVNICLVVPIVPDESFSLTLTHKLLNATSILVMVALSWIVSRSLSFDYRNWHLSFLMQVVFGFATPREPQKLAERIFFGSLLVCCLLNASYIYTAITESTLQKASAIKLDTIEDVVSSRFRLVLHPQAFAAFYKNSGGNFKQLLEKSVQDDATGTSCIEKMAKHKNMSCFAEEAFAYFMNEKERAGGPPVMKIIKEYLVQFSGATFLEWKSPYVRRFDELKLRLGSSGFTEKWELSRFLSRTTVDVNKTNWVEVLDASSISVRLLVRILVFGYVCSLIVFVCELIVFRHKLAIASPTII